MFIWVENDLFEKKRNYTAITGNSFYFLRFTSINASFIMGKMSTMTVINRDF